MTAHTALEVEQHATLRAVEHVQIGLHGRKRCPCCKTVKPYHASDCKLAAVLAKFREAT